MINIFKRTSMIFIILMILSASMVSANSMAESETSAITPMSTVETAIAVTFPTDSVEVLPTQTPPPNDDGIWIDQSRRRISGDFTYHILSREKKYITILKVANTKKKVVFPKELDGYKVIGIGQTKYLPEMNYKESRYEQEILDYTEDDDLFVFGEKQGSVKEITIPECVRFIGNSAFDSCSSLKKVNFVKRKKNLKIGSRTFGSCNSLVKVNIPNKVIIAGNSFDNCGEFNCISVSGLIENIYAFNNTNINKMIMNNKTMNLFPVWENETDVLVIRDKVKSLGWCYYGYGYDVVRPDFNSCIIHKMIVQGKKTKIQDLKSEYQSIGKLYTVKGARAIKWAKKNKVKYKVIKAAKLNKMTKG